MGAAQLKNQICHAIDLDDPDRLVLLLKDHSSMVNAVIRDDTKQTSLLRSIQKRNYTIANILLGDFGADVNFLSGMFTPLMMASVKDSTQLIELLTYFKAQVCKLNKKDLSAIDYAIIYGSYKSLLYFKNKMNIDVSSHFKDLQKIQKQARSLAVPYVNYRLLQVLIQANVSDEAYFKQIFNKKSKTQIVKSEIQTVKNPQKSAGGNWFRKNIIEQLSNISVGQRTKSEQDENYNQNRNQFNSHRILEGNNGEFKKRQSIESYFTSSSSPRQQCVA